MDKFNIQYEYMSELDSVEKCIRDYRFSNTPLEKTITYLLSLYSISPACLKDQNKEEALSLLSNMLVEYKFNRHNHGTSLTAKNIHTWLTDNAFKLRGSSGGGYGSGGSFGF